jgi:hypothetical protein
LGFGQTVEKWTTVALTADVWATAATSEMPSRKLVLRPGRHKVRVAFEFNPSGGGVVPASPVSGPVEIEILPAKSVGHASDWGEPSKGVSSRIRTTKPKFAFGEGVTLELDVKAAGDGGRELAVWTAARNSSPSRVEFDGVWYKRVPDEVARVLAPKLTAGEQVDGWATLNLSDQWVVEYYTGIPPEQVSERLTLSPGKHKLRVGFSFSNPTASAVPVSGPLEIEVLPVTGTATPPPGAGWRSKTVWIPHGAAGLKHLAVVADEKHLFTAGKDGVILWDVSGPEPKAEQKVAFTISGLSMAGLDRDGNPLLVRRVDRPQTRGSLTDLTVLRLPDVGERLPPTVTVDSDNLRQFAVSADGRTLAVMLGGWGGVKLIDVASRNEQTLDAPKVAGKYEPYPHALFFSRDGKTLIGLGSSDYPVHGEVNGRVVCWDTETGKVRWQADELAGHPIGALSPDGRTLVTGGSLVSPEVVVWDMATGTRRARRETAASALAVSPDGNTVLVGAPSKDSPRRGVLQVWDLAWNEPLAQAIPVPANIQFLSIRDDGRAFATADSAGEVRWWEWKK